MPPQLDIDILDDEGDCIAKNIKCVADTGADICVFPTSAFTDDQYRELDVYTPSFQANCANQTKLKLDGCFTARMRLSDASVQDVHLMRIYLSPSVSKPLLSFNALTLFNLLPDEFPYIQAVSSGSNNDAFQKRMEDLFKEFDDVFCDEPEEPMDFPPLELHLKPKEEWNHAKHPFQVTTTRAFKTHIADASLRELERLVRLGVIERTNEPSAWCANSFFLSKENGDVRLITDFSQLGSVLERPIHPFPCVQDIIKSLTADNVYFCSMDAKQGYFQLALHPDSRHLTTFLTPIGRFRYCRLPMGLNVSGDHWCRASDAALEGLRGNQKIVDDILTGARSENELYIRVKAVLLRCRSTGMKLNRAKIQFGTTVNFAGHVISSDGVKPDQGKFDAIRCFPTPKNITDIQSFLGLANQLAIGLPDLSQAAHDLRLLLKKDTAFVWTDAQEKSFQAVKEIITSERIVAPYSIGKPTKILCDASRSGLGYVLLQFHNENDAKPRLIQCSSRSLTGPESRYSVTELELLGLVYAIKHCDHYLSHSPEFTVITDHRALEGIFKKDLSELDGRILRIREKVLQYNFKVQWLEGKANLMADCLSRTPHFKPTEDEVKASDDLKIVYALDIETLEDPMLVGITDAALADKQYSMLVEFIDKFSLSTNKIKLLKTLRPDHPAHPYKHCLNDLHVYQDLVHLGSRIVVPRSFLPSILKNLHLGHPGKNRMLTLARRFFKWDTMKKDIHDTVENCALCASMLPSKPLKENANIDFASEPMDILGMDLFQLSTQHYLVIVDLFSSYFFFKKLHSLTTASVLTQLSHVLTRFGFCRLIISDGGPQFRGEFDNFCDENFIIHRTSSPYHAPSNGASEAAVKRVKYLLSKVKDKSELDMHVLGCLSTPLTGEIRSPAELFFQRPIRLPGRPISYPSPAGLKRYDRQYTHPRGDVELEHHEEPKPDEPPPAFKIGDKVLVQNKKKRWVIPAIIDGARRNGRSFNMTTAQGENLLRNQRYIRHFDPEKQKLHAAQYPQDD